MIKCKDCKYFHKTKIDEGYCTNDILREEEYFFVPPSNDWFCGFAESKAEWIPGENPMCYQKCSLCGESSIVKSKYCPNCGVEMQK